MFSGKATGDPAIDRDSTRFADSLGAEYDLKGFDGLVARIKYGFYDYVSNLRFTEEEIANQQALADLRYPAEWYPVTRKLQRTIHLHVGPTNSGKTYHALKSLESAETGMYAGPLRLLAHEVYSRMNAKGRPCALITGEERRAPNNTDGTPDFSLVSCTVEMLDLTNLVDVAVIDEIQMLGSDERGWAWTQALLGVQAYEVHLCGETRTVPLVQQLCAMTGDKLIIHKYDRLSPLQMDKKSLDGDLSGLRKGDCIVSFSVMGIHALRKAIEDKTGKKVAIVYGSLPPETRAQQARLFNDPDNEYDFLVASDAIGMGLNLSIKRIIFETTVKFDGTAERVIDAASIKQIAGRAGRYKTAQDDAKMALQDQDLAAAKGESAEDVNLPSPYDIAMSSTTTRPTPSTHESSVGLVTTLEKYDFPVVHAAMRHEPRPIKTSGVFAPPNIVDRFAQCFPPGTPFSYVLMRLNEISQLNERFHLCGLRDALWIADLIEPLRNLSIHDRMIFANSPASFSDRTHFDDLIPELARAVESQSGGALYELRTINLELLQEEPMPHRSYLRRLETLHKSLVLYLWLSFRFHGIFNTRELATEVKRRVEDRIETVLEGLSLESKRQAKVKQREQKRWMLEGSDESDTTTVESPSDSDGLDLGVDRRERQLSA
ncbi:hypothetical protein ANO11243_082220 [Dothideomycetidae sp. 11243]|nr:hypothetical protein ANO11243_082220 [fungal sp. No.11243]